MPYGHLATPQCHVLTHQKEHNKGLIRDQARLISCRALGNEREVHPQKWGRGIKGKRNRKSGIILVLRQKLSVEEVKMLVG